MSFLRNSDNPGSVVIIPDSITNDVQTGPYVNMITNYAAIDLAKVRRYEDYLKNAASRQSQNLDMLYQLIWSSLSEEGQNVIGFWES